MLVVTPTVSGRQPARSPILAPCFIRRDEQPHERHLHFSYVDHMLELHREIMQGASPTGGGKGRTFTPNALTSKIGIVGGSHDVRSLRPTHGSARTNGHHHGAT